MSRQAVAELVFMMVILKIPVVYLAVVVYWAVRSEPRPPEPALRPAWLPEPDAGPQAQRWLRRRGGPRFGPRTGPRPHGSPVRTYARRASGIRAGAG